MSLTYGFCLDDITSTYDSAQFADAFHALVGDGITPHGARFALTINGFSATLASGFALAAGRWVKSDEPLSLSLPASGNRDDRTDALAVRVDYEARKTALEVLVDVDAAAIRADPSLVRGYAGYSLALYFIHVRRGATTLSPEDVTDMRADEKLCGDIKPLSVLSKNILYIYNFLISGIDLEVARLIGLSNQAIEKGDAAIARLNEEITASGGVPLIGELMVARTPPAPEREWLVCDGSVVPQAYPVLSALLGGDLPDILAPAEKFQTYIYGGRPEGGDG